MYYDFGLHCKMGLYEDEKHKQHISLDKILRLSQCLKLTLNTFSDFSLSNLKPQLNFLIDLKIILNRPTKSIQSTHKYSLK